MRIIFFVLSLLLVNISVLLAETSLVSYSEKNWKMNCDETSSDLSEMNCKIKAGKTNVLNVFKIQNPTRLVIDLAPENKKQNENLNVADNALVNGIRTGWHKDKFRIVFDLNQENRIEYKWKNTKQGLELDLHSTSQETKRGNAQNAKLNSPSKKTIQLAENKKIDLKDSIEAPKINDQTKIISAIRISPKVKDSEHEKTSTNGASKEALVMNLPKSAKKLSGEDLKNEKVEIAKTESALEAKALEEQEIGTIKLEKDSAPINQEDTEPVRAKLAEQPVEVKSLKEAPVEDEKQDDQITVQMLKGIAFKTDAESEKNSVHILLNLKPEFNLAKTSPRTYRLRITDCELADDRLALPYFPPHTFKSISYIQAEQNRRSTDITIGVDRNSRLLAIPAKNGIKIKVVN